MQNPDRPTHESDGFLAHSYLSGAAERLWEYQASRLTSALAISLAKEKAKEKPKEKATEKIPEKPIWRMARTIPTVTAASTAKQLAFNFGEHIDVAITKRPSALGLLEKAVEAGDERAFIETVREIEWGTLQARDIVRAVKLAIKVGLPRAARYILTEGERTFPENDELQKYTRLLASATVLPRPEQDVPDQGSNIAWLKAHGVRYRGKWLALKDGQLLGVEVTLKELVRKIGDTTGVMLTPVS